MPSEAPSLQGKLVRILHCQDFNAVVAYSKALHVRFFLPLKSLVLLLSLTTIQIWLPVQAHISTGLASLGCSDGLSMILSSIEKAAGFRVGSRLVRFWSLDRTIYVAMVAFCRDSLLFISQATDADSIFRWASSQIHTCCSLLAQYRPCWLSSTGTIIQSPRTRQISAMSPLRASWLVWYFSGFLLLHAGDKRLRVYYFDVRKKRRRHEVDRIRTAWPS